MTCKIRLCLARGVSSSFSKFKYSGGKNSWISFLASSPLLSTCVEFIRVVFLPPSGRQGNAPLRFYHYHSRNISTFWFLNHKSTFFDILAVPRSISQLSRASKLSPTLTWLDMWINNMAGVLFSSSRNCISLSHFFFFSIIPKNAPGTSSWKSYLVPHCNINWILSLLWNVLEHNLSIRE